MCAMRMKRPLFTEMLYEGSTKTVTFWKVVVRDEVLSEQFCNLPDAPPTPC